MKVRKFILRYCLGVICMAVILLIVTQSLHASQVTCISEKTIKKIVTDHIKKNISIPESSVRIEFFPGISDLTIPGENVTWRVTHNRNEDFIGYITVSIRFYQGNVFLKKKAVRAKVEVFKNVVVASRFLEKNSIIDSDDVKVIQRWCNRRFPNSVAYLSEVLGKKLNVKVNQDTEITRTMLREQLSVKRGKLVRIVLERGPLMITTIGMSEQDGKFGELVKVKNLSSKKTVYAKVVGDALVSVEY